MVTEPSAITSYGVNLSELRKPLSALGQPINTKIENQLAVKQQPANKQPLATKTEQPTSGDLLAKQPLVEAQKTQPTAEEKEDDNANVLSPDELHDLLDEINNTLYAMHKSLRFELNDKTEDMVVRVVNTDTDEVIRQYPSEEVLKRKEQLLEGETTAFNARVD